MNKYAHIWRDSADIFCSASTKDRLLGPPSIPLTIAWDYIDSIGVVCPDCLRVMRDDIDANLKRNETESPFALHPIGEWDEDVGPVIWWRVDTSAVHACDVFCDPWIGMAVADRDGALKIDDQFEQDYPYWSYLPSVIGEPESIAKKCICDSRPRLVERDGLPDPTRHECVLLWFAQEWMPWTNDADFNDISATDYWLPMPPDPIKEIE